MPITYRAIVPQEADAFFDADSFGFGNDPQLEWRAATLEYADLTRTVAAFDGGEIVGTAGAWTFDLTVPGNTMPCGGVTWVSVIPTHRRRGILTGMMRTQLEGIRERGEAIAALWASEAPIYSRFGYGMAAEGADAHIERAHAAIRHRVPYGGRTRRVDREEALSAWPAIYDRVRVETPGFLSRSPGWWSNRIIRPANLERRSDSPGMSSAFLVQYEEGGEPLGYVRYRIRDEWRDGVPASELRIVELMPATDSARSALWDYIVGVDLIKTISWEAGPVDEPLIHMLADPRRLVRRTGDTIWVRIIDVPRALESRKYSAEGRVIFEVADPFLPWASGRFALEAGPSGARCTPAAETADVHLTTVELAAAYLGYSRFQTLARAGRVTGSAEALRAADAMFAWDPLPWCPEVF